MRDRRDCSQAASSAVTLVPVGVARKGVFGVIASESRLYWGEPIECE